MKRVLKWVGITLGVLATLVFILFGALFYQGGEVFARVYPSPADPVVIPSGPEAVEKGAHIAVTRGCENCHDADYGGGQLFIASDALFTLAAPNLTSGKGGIGEVMTDEAWVNAIRYGINHEGHGLLIMPSEVYYTLNDEDLGNLIAFLKTLPPVDRENPARAIGTVGRVLLATGEFPLSADLVTHQPTRLADVPPGPTAEYGQYVANSVCVLCHGQNLAGQVFPPGGGPDSRLTPNLTPGGEMIVWSEADFVTAMRTGVKPNGSTLDPDLMPWKQLGQLSDDELAAIFAYLKSLPKTPSPTQ